MNVVHGLKNGAEHVDDIRWHYKIWMNREPDIEISWSVNTSDTSTVCLSEHVCERIIGEMKTSNSRFFIEEPEQQRCSLETPVLPWFDRRNSRPKPLSSTFGISSYARVGEARSYSGLPYQTC